MTEPVGGQQLIAWGFSQSNGPYYDLSGSLSSDTPSVMTMTNGVATGVSPGSAHYTGTDNSAMPVYLAQFCSTTMCPTTYIGSCGGTATIVARVPTSIGYVGENAHGSANCLSGQSGFSRQVTLQVVDQFGSPATIQNWTLDDVITVGSPHDLGQNPTSTGEIDGVGGPFLDQLFVCSTACPQSTGSTVALQQWTGNLSYPLGSNVITYKCNSITWDGH